MIFTKKSLSRDYFFIAFLMIMGVVSLSLGFSFYFYHSYKQRIYQQFINSANRIEYVIDESFDYATHLAHFAGKKIIEDNLYSSEKIASILKDKFLANSISEELFSLTIFDWSNANQQLIVCGGEVGILPKSKDVSFRHYAKMAPLFPWKLHFDPPGIGLVSNQHMIPAGMGITDKQGKFVGILSMGFDLANFNKRIRHAIKDNTISFIILSEDYTTISYSPNNALDLEDKSFFANAFMHIDSSQLLTKPIIYGNIAYKYVKKMGAYPYIILVGAEQSLLQKELINVLLPRIAEFIGLGSIAFFALIFLRKFLVSPILHLSHIAQKIASEEDVTIPLGKDYPEIDALKEQLRLIQHVKKQLVSSKEEACHQRNVAQSAIEEVQEINASLERRVEERTLHLEEALKIRMHILNNMSHEIRTPITGILHISRALVEDWPRLNENKKFDCALHVAQNAARLTSLINNILDLSKLNAGKMIFSFRKMNIAALIKDMIIECKNLYLQGKDISFHFHIVPHLDTSIVIDQERVIQLLRNLYANAIKFTSSGSIDAFLEEIIIEETRHLRFTLQDEGIGIPKGELDSIFEPFNESSYTTSRAGGTGLGLSICHEIVKGHQGNIHAEHAPKKGSRFIFTLPCNLEETPFLSEEPEVPSYIDYYASDTYSSNAEMVEALHIMKAKNPTILVIDDEMSCLEAITLILESKEYEVIQAHNGSEALEKLALYHEKIDVIFLDLMMPDIYGLHLFEEMLKKEEYRNIPVILLSGTSDEEEIRKAFALGIAAHLRKPYTKKELFTTLTLVYKANYMNEKSEVA